MQGIQNLTLKVGEKLNLSVPVAGLPKPTVDWKFNEKEIIGKTFNDHLKIKTKLYSFLTLQIFSEDNRVKITDLSSSTTLNIKEVARKDTGAYKLTLTNSVATKSYNINVKVLGKEL